jgi:anti-sigma B factor antagonist
MNASFRVTNRRSGCCSVVEMSGDLDMATAPALEDVIDRMMVIPDHIIADVSQLTFIDTTGLRLLMRASELVERRIWLQGASNQLRRLLDVSGTSEFFCLEEERVNAHRVIARGRASRARGLNPKSTELASTLKAGHVYRVIGRSVQLDRQPRAEECFEGLRYVGTVIPYKDGFADTGDPTEVFYWFSKHHFVLFKSGAFKADEMLT